MLQTTICQRTVDLITARQRRALAFHLVRATFVRFFLSLSLSLSLLLCHSLQHTLIRFGFRHATGDVAAGCSCYLSHQQPAVRHGAALEPII